MTAAACEQVHGFADGELPGAQYEAFRAHLVTCDRCRRELETIVAFKGLMESMAGGQDLAARLHSVTAEVPSVRMEQPRRSWWVWGGLGGAVGLAAAAVLLFLGRRHNEGPVAFHLPATRTLEARLSYAPADQYRPFERMRGGASAARSPDLATLAAMEKRGDRKGLVVSWLLDGDVKQAGALLSAAPSDHTLDNERGVAALLDHRPEDALGFLDAAFARDARATQAIWNRGLALRDMGLPLAAARSLESVAALQEPGWSGEARAEAERLRADVTARKRRWEDADREGWALAIDHTAPRGETMDRFPELMRRHFYEALRTAQAPAHFDVLAQVAAVLDRHAGGRVLQAAVQRAARIGNSRKDLLAAYAGFVARRWKQIKPAEAADLEQRLRAAGARDLLVGLFTGLRVDDERPGEFRTLIDKDPGLSQDPWMRLHAREAVLTTLASGDAGVTPEHEREAGLRRAIADATADKFLYWKGRFHTGLIDLFMRQGRLREAFALAESLRSEARGWGDWFRELSALRQLSRLANLRGATSVLRAYADELGLGESDDSCRTKRIVNQLMAERALLDGRTDEARRLLADVPVCGDGRGLGVQGLRVLSEVVAREKTPGTRDLFLKSLANWREKDGIVMTGGERAMGLVMEGQAMIPTEPVAGALTLRRAIEAAETLPDHDSYAAKARLWAHRALIADLGSKGGFAEALSLMAAERHLDLPQGCVLGLAEGRGQVTVVAKGSDGKIVGDVRANMNVGAGVGAQIEEKFQGCDDVAVLALPPFHGRSRLLSPGVAWRHFDGDVASGGQLSVTRRIVVADVTPPRTLDLPILAPWQPRRGSVPFRILRGTEARPTDVLGAMADGDLIEFHVHGLVDLAQADASFLVLSPDADGRYALTAGEVRQTWLPRRPLVVLAACDSAADASYGYERWSKGAAWTLPSAFLHAGARAVLAATAPLPDQAAGEFFADVVGRIESSASPSVALRDIRKSWISRGADWVQDIVLFQ